MFRPTVARQHVTESGSAQGPRVLDQGPCGDRCEADQAGQFCGRPPSQTWPQQDNTALAWSERDSGSGGEEEEEEESTGVVILTRL